MARKNLTYGKSKMVQGLRRRHYAKSTESCLSHELHKKAYLLERGKLTQRALRDLRRRMWVFNGREQCPESRLGRFRKGGGIKGAPLKFPAQAEGK